MAKNQNTFKKKYENKTNKKATQTYKASDIKKITWTDTSNVEATRTKCEDVAVLMTFFLSCIMHVPLLSNLSNT